MAAIPTIQVTVKGHTGPVTINEEDFDKAVHKAFKGSAAASQEPAQPEEPSPATPLAEEAQAALDGASEPAPSGGWGQPETEV